MNSNTRPSFDKFTLPLWIHTLSLPNLQSATLTVVQSKMGFLVVVPFLLAILVMKLPSTFVELALGQYSKRGAFGVWKFCPILRGVGLCGALTFVIYQIYHNVTSAHYFHFALSCFRVDIEWNHSVNNGTVEEFWTHRVINNKDQHSFEHPLYLSLISMFLVFLINYHETATLERVLPYLLAVPVLQGVLMVYLALLLCPRTIVRFFTNVILRPDLDQFLDLDNWKLIVENSQISGGFALGTYVTLGSRCRFRDSIYVTTILAGLVDVVTTISYSVLMHIFVENAGLSVARPGNVVSVIVPEALRALPGPLQFWAGMWFTQLYIIGIIKMAVMMQVNLLTLAITWPSMTKYSKLSLLSMCLAIYALGTLFYTVENCNIATFRDVTDRFILTFLNWFHSITIIFFYGLNRFADDCRFMLGGTSHSVLVNCYFVTSLVLGAIFVRNVVDFYLYSNNSRVGFIVQNSIIWFMPTMVLLGVLRHVFQSTKNKYVSMWGAHATWGPDDAGLEYSRHMFSQASKRSTDKYIYRKTLRT